MLRGFLLGALFLITHLSNAAAFPANSVATISTAQPLEWRWGNSTTAPGASCDEAAGKVILTYPTWLLSCGASSLCNPAAAAQLASNPLASGSASIQFCASACRVGQSCSSNWAMNSNGAFISGCPSNIATRVVSGVCLSDACPANSSGMFNFSPSPSTVPYSPRCTCKAGLVADSSGTNCVPAPPAATVCPAGQVPHKWGGCMLDCPAGSFSNLRNTTCVASNCPIPPLTPLVDAASLDFEKGTRWRPDLLTPAYQAKLKCVQDGITARGGTYTGISAYRPIPYQKHLLEVVTKDAQLNALYIGNHPECQALRIEVTTEMGTPPGHALKFKQLVSTTVSRHSQGTAFDLTPHGLTAAQMSPVYAGCGVVNTAVKGELWHTQ